MVVTLATTHLTGHEHVGQEVHLHVLVSIAETRLTASTANVKREAPRLISAYLRLRQSHEEVTYISKHPRVCRGVRAWRTPQWRLVHGYHLVNVFHPLDALVGQWLAQRAIEVLRQYRLQGIVDERRLARATHARHTDERTQREVHVHPLEVVSRSPLEAQHLAIAFSACLGHLNLHLSVEVL